MNGHVTTFARIVLVVHQLAHEILHCKSTLLEDTSLSILARYNVVWTQCCSRTYSDAFLPSRDLTFL